MDTGDRVNSYIRRIERIRLLSSFETIWRVITDDHDLSSDERSTIYNRIVECATELWFTVACAKFNMVHGETFESQEIPGNFENRISYPGRIIEAWAIKCLHDNDENYNDVARQILVEYTPGRYPRLPFENSIVHSKECYRIRGDVYYFVKIRTYRVIDGLDFRVSLYRDFDLSPRSIIYDPED